MPGRLGKVLKSHRPPGGGDQAHVKIVVVKTNPGYAPGPANEGPERSPLLFHLGQRGPGHEREEESMRRLVTAAVAAVPAAALLAGCGGASSGRSSAGHQASASGGPAGLVTQADASQVLVQCTVAVNQANKSRSLAALAAVGSSSSYRIDAGDRLRRRARHGQVDNPARLPPVWLVRPGEPLLGPGTVSTAPTHPHLPARTRPGRLPEVV